MPTENMHFISQQFRGQGSAPLPPHAACPSAVCLCLGKELNNCELQNQKATCLQVPALLSVVSRIFSVSSEHHISGKHHI